MKELRRIIRLNRRGLRRIEETVEKFSPQPEEGEQRRLRRTEENIPPQQEGTKEN